MILGLALFTPLAIVGAVFYLVHHIIVKANLFLVAGVAQRIAGSTDLSAIGGLYKTAPLLGVLFLIPAFSLAGFPAAQRVLGEIRSGQGLTRRRGLLDRRRGAGRGAVDDLLHDENLGQRVLETAPGGPSAEAHLARCPKDRASLLVPIAALAVLTCIIGFFPEPFVAFAERSAEQLLDPTAYVTAVMGEMPDTRVGPGATGGK
jgi:multicomponent Na+:H+ antiporter subunit D